jgi:hypothetical protein
MVLVRLAGGGVIRCVEVLGEGLAGMWRMALRVSWGRGRTGVGWLFACRSRVGFRGIAAFMLVCKFGLNTNI